MPDRPTGSSQPSRGLVADVTIKLAERMLVASRVVAHDLPQGYSPPSPINFLLELFLAEESGRYLSSDDIGRNDDVSRRVVERWIAALADEGFVETSGQAVGLTDRGYDTVTSMLARLFESQRLLD